LTSLITLALIRSETISRASMMIIFCEKGNNIKIDEKIMFFKMETIGFGQNQRIS